MFWATFTLGLVALSASFVSAVDPYTGGDTSGCGTAHLFDGLPRYLSLDTGGTTRSYWIHLPSDYHPDQQYPVVFGFHGRGTNGEFFYQDTHLSMPRFSANKIMVYPDGLGRAWAGPEYAKASVEQDLQFVWDMLAHVRSKYCVDSARIYATGFSNGAGFLDTLACNATVGGEFAAFAPASGVYYTEPDGACEPARTPMPFLEMHGQADGAARYAGGRGTGGTLPQMSDWLALWADRNGCGDPKQEDSDGGNVHFLSYDCKGDQGAGALQHWRVDDMGMFRSHTSFCFDAYAISSSACMAGTTH